jgi:hypothetical protein
MENEIKYGQENFNLPHDVISLPSKGIFYKNKKSSIKVGYLTASDENILMSQNNREGIIQSLLRQKIYEPGFNINEMLDCDVQAVLVFLRNTAFGPEYIFNLVDPINGKNFEATILIDEINYIQPKHNPDENGLFTFKLPKSNAEVKLKLLTIGEQKELDKLSEQYPVGMVAPIVTKKLEKQIVELNGNTDKSKISQFVNQMPISDSKDIRKFLSECEPKLDLERKIIAPSGEEVKIDITFGVEFFRPFF